MEPEVVLCFRFGISYGVYNLCKISIDSNRKPVLICFKELSVFSMQREKQPIKVSRQSVVCHLAGKGVLKLFFESVV